MDGTAGVPTLFASDFERRVTLDDGAMLSTAPRARRDGRRGPVSMTGRFGYEASTRRHAVEYVDEGGVAAWLSVAGRPMGEPDEGSVRSVPVRFTDGTTR